MHSRGGGTLKEDARLTNERYLGIHKRLRNIWLHEPSAFGYLCPEDQWILHDYFQLSKDLTDEELLTHRRKVTDERPSLPHQAGHVLADFMRILVELMRDGRQQDTPPPKRRRGRVHKRVLAVVNPELDTKTIARLLVNLAWREMMEKGGKSEEDRAA